MCLYHVCLLLAVWHHISPLPSIHYKVEVPFAFRTSHTLYLNLVYVTACSLYALRKVKKLRFRVFAGQGSSIAKLPQIESQKRILISNLASD